MFLIKIFKKNVNVINVVVRYKARFLTKILFINLSSEPQNLCECIRNNYLITVWLYVFMKLRDI